MSKQYLHHKQRGRDFAEDLESLMNGSPLAFTNPEHIKIHEREIESSGLVPAIVDVFGHKVGVVMKNELRGAILDPSADDLDVLEAARDSYTTYVCERYGSKARIPSEATLGRTIHESYVNSLIGNILEFPRDVLNERKLEQYGLRDEKVLSLADKAFKEYCGTSSSLNLGGSLGCVDSVGGTGTVSGRTDTVNLSEDVCEAGSHYKLNLKCRRIQEDVQKEVPVLSHQYTQIESEAVKLMRKYCPRLTQKTATNLFRMFLNLGGAYNEGKPLPLV